MSVREVLSLRFGHLERCGQLSQADLEAALASREDCKALLDRMGEIAAPGTGAPAILTVFASLASAACDWLDGDLAIELVEEDEVTTVRMMTDLGGGMREKLFRPFELRVPLAEMTAAVERTPELVGALTMRKVSWRRVLLDVSGPTRRSTMPPKIGVSDASLWMLDNMGDSQRAQAREPDARFRSEPPSGDIDCGWDDPKT